MHRLLTSVCQDCGPSYKDIKDWIQEIVEGSEEVDECVCQGLKLGGDKTGDPALVARVETIITEDPHITLDGLAELALSQTSIIQVSSW